jgi:hypothetical protein
MYNTHSDKSESEREIQGVDTWNTSKSGNEIHSLEQ